MSGSRSDLATRFGVAIALIGLAFAALWFGGWLFWLVTTVGALLMLSEWAELDGASAGQKRLAQYALMVPLAIMAPLAAGPGFFALGLVGAAFFFIAAVTRRTRLALGTLYVGLPVLALLLLREHPEGFYLTFWTMAVVWACDTGAYFAGRAIGGPKLAPSISPNKTWAGAIGGVLAAYLFTWIFLFTYALAWLSVDLGSWRVMLYLSPFLAALAQAGDLFESHFKRLAGVKDSGNILPGHGGLLDRLDGLVPVAPVVAVAMVLQWFSVVGDGGWWW